MHRQDPIPCTPSNYAYTVGRSSPHLQLSNVLGQNSYITPSNTVVLLQSGTFCIFIESTFMDLCRNLESLETLRVNINSIV